MSLFTCASSRKHDISSLSLNKIYCANYLQIVIKFYIFISVAAHFASTIFAFSNDFTNVNKPLVVLLGPGIQNAELIYPSRYFFVLHRVDIDSINIRAKDSSYENNCRIWPQVFKESKFCLQFNISKLAENNLNLATSFELISNLFDYAEYCDDEKNFQNESTEIVSYHLAIVRYKLYDQSSCDISHEVIITGKKSKEHSNLEIIHRQSLGKRSLFYSEQCNCPIESWPEKMQCSLINKFAHAQIESDLKVFAKGIDFDLVLNDTVNRFANYTRSYAFCLYQIISNQLYKKCFGEYVGFSKFYDEIFLSLLRKVPISNTEFVVNLGDWPLSDKHKDPLPILSWCGSTDTYDIVLPTYELTESIIHAQGRVSTDILSVFGQQKLTFSHKDNRLFWRGRDSNLARLKLIKQSFNNPDLFNVSITNFFFFRDEMDQYTTTPVPHKTGASNTKIPYVPFLEFFNYRYQINIDGTVAAYRLPFLLAGNSLVIKQQSKYYEFFYHLLTSGKHYLQVDQDLDDLTKLLHRLTEHGVQSGQYSLPQIKETIWKARRFVLRHLLPENIYCYYYQILQNYTGMLTNVPIRLRPDAELVLPSDQDQPQPKCACDSASDHSLPLKTEL